MILKLLTFEEGFRANPYFCTEGFPTIGIGKKIGCKGIPLSAYNFTVTRVIAEAWLKEETIEIFTKLDRCPWFSGLSHTRQCIVVSMAYQMGVDGVKRFKNMIKAIEAEDFKLAAKEALDSKWAKQTPARAERHADVLESGDLRSGYADLWS